MNNEVELSLQQFSTAWQLMAGETPGYAQAMHEGVEYIFSGLPMAFLNIALPRQASLSAEALRASGEAACTWAADKAVPWMFILTHETLEEGLDATAVLDACGLAPVLNLTGMTTDQLTPATILPEGLELAVAQDDAACAAIIDINTAAYDMDLESSKDTLGKRRFWQDHIAVVGKVEGQPVSSTCVLIADGYHYVALVATRPEQQRHGYANAVMRHALELAAQTHGKSKTVLHATDAGRPVYERLGYQPISTHMLFMEKRFLGDH